MSAKPKKLALMLTIAVILVSLTLANMTVVDASSTVGEIDLFTQKEPYSGKGPNAPSDAFGLEEEVQIYALATYNEYPVQSLLVAFQILGPPNTVENISFYRVAFTDDMGVATISFRISHLNETTFGEWTVIGNTRIGDLTFTDTVAFKVGWIIEIVSLKTVNEHRTEQEEFTRGSYVGIELVLRNIAMTEKITSLTVTIYDCLGTFVNATELSDFAVQPNGTLVYTYFLLYVPKSAHVGRATVYACAYTAFPRSNGVPYCPEVSKYFLITSRKYFLKVGTEPPHVVAILGEGWYGENANVSLTATWSILVSNGVRYNFSFWDVDGLSQGKGVNSINVFMDANHTATAHYILQYYLTVNSPYGTSSGAGWYDAGSTAYATLDIGILDHENGIRRVFTNWGGDASGTYYTQSNPIIMDNPKTAIANWKTRCYLTVSVDPPGISVIVGEGWYDEGTNVNLTASEYILAGIATGVRYRLSYWDVDGTSKLDNPIMVTMDAHHTATAHYILQYYLTVRTDPPGIATILGEDWYDESSNVTLNAPAVSDYNFGYWGVNGVSRGSGVNAITVYMNAPQTVTAHYTRIITYTLTITTTDGGTTDPEPGTYNYTAGSTVQVTAISNVNYVFDHWELDNVDVGSVNPYTVTMDKNHTLKAVFSQAPSAWFVPEWFYWLLLLIILIIIFLIIWFYRRKRRKEAEEAFYTGWTAWYYCYDLRSKTRKI
jgi:hypothetical protein